MPKFSFILSAAQPGRRAPLSMGLLCGAVLLLSCFAAIHGERDFNLNESQVPVLEPKDETHHIKYTLPEDSYAMEMSRCDSADSEILLSLVLKQHDWHDFNDTRRVKVLNKLSKFFAIPKEFIVMETVKKYDLREMQKAAVRKGENKCHSSKRLLGRVNFMIGCGSSYFKVGEPIANQIGAQMRDGTIDQLTGEKFGWWIIWHKDSDVRSQRQRRQAVEGSGDGDDYEYDDDYDYGDDAEPEVTTETHTHRHQHGASVAESIARPTGEDAEEESADNNSINTISDTDETLHAPPQPPPASSQGPSSPLNGQFTDGPAVVDEDDEVSQLESVISKTIENTQNLKELPGLEGDVMPPHVEVPTVAEIEKELDLEFSNELAAHGTGNDATTAAASAMTTSGTSSSTMGNIVMPPGTDEENLRTVTQPLSPRGGEVDFTGAAATANGPPIGVPIEADDDEEDDDDVYDEDEKVEDNETVAAPQSGASAPDVGSERLSSSQQAADGIDGQPIGTNTVEVDEAGGVIDASAAATTIHAFATTAASAAYATTTPSASTTPASASSSATISASSSTGGGEFHLHHTHTDTPSSSSAAADTQSSTFVLTPTQTSEQHHHNHHQHGHQQPEHHQHQHQHHHQQHNHEHESVATPLPPTQSESHSPPAHQSSHPSSSSSTSNDSDTESLSSLSSPSSSFSVSSTISLLGSTTTTTTTPYDSSATISTIQTGEGHQSKDASTVQPANSVNQDADAKATPLANESESSTSASPAAVEASSVDTPEPMGTDETESNSAPMIKTRLQKLAITSGKSFRFTVPAETFYDNEDDTNLRLLLTEKDGRELKPSSWLQFDGETRELYGLPLDDTVSKYQYLLSATDSGNESVTETVEISVQQHHSIRSVNHEVSVAVKINDKQMLNIDWQLKLIKAIADTLGDSSTDSIVVREVRQNPQEPGAAVFVYFNETLPTSSCPESELNRLVKDLDAQRLSELVSPSLGIKSISGQLIGACQKSHTTKPKLSATPTKNIAPIPVNQVDRVNALVGQLLVYKVPSDTFYDANDDPLKLTLRTKDNKDIPASHWLQFDSKNKEFYGIPKSQDAGKEEEFILVAEDSGGLTATDALVVVVRSAPKRDYSVSFKAYLAIRQEQFDSLLQRKFVERIAELNGDQTTEFVQIRTVSDDHDSDGLVVTFFNTTLHKSQNRCPDDQIDAVRSVYLMQDHILRDRVKKVIGNELRLTNLKVLTGMCDLKMDTGHRDNIPIPTENEPTLKSSFQDYMYTVILPALIIITMILIASIIACCLHRRRRKSGKMELGDEEERKAFRKGIPVIFQDELDEKPEIGNKSPIILKDEKPPLLPPSYNTSNMNGDTDVDEYVPPPAVVMGGREARGKSPATPSYRKPPPYVSP